MAIQNRFPRNILILPCPQLGENKISSNGLYRCTCELNLLGLEGRTIIVICSFEKAVFSGQDAQKIQAN
jgi:hypothetical protein